MIADPARAKVDADLAALAFRDGVRAGRWRVPAHDFPRLDVEVAGLGNDGRPRWYGFRMMLENYPAQAPHVRIWDLTSNGPLAQAERPRTSPRLQVSFQQWSSDTVYRPWERLTGPHNNNALTFPKLAWRPDRRLSFILEDLHGLLNSAGRAGLLGPAA